MRELARAMVNRGQSIKIAIFSFQEQCCKSYQCTVASYWVNKESVGDLENVFLRTMSVKVIQESFVP